MYEKRMVILNDRLMLKIDEYRGRLNRAEFVGECVERLLREVKMEREAPVERRERTKPVIAPDSAEYVTKKEFEQFKWNIDKLQQEFIDFFIKYGKQLAMETLSREEAERFSNDLRRLLQL